MASSESNKYEARALHNSVLPTPVGPRNTRLAIGLKSLMEEVGLRGQINVHEMLHQIFEPEMGDRYNSGGDNGDSSSDGLTY